jgi:hypothetical protein
MTIEVEDISGEEFLTEEEKAIESSNDRSIDLLLSTLSVMQEPDRNTYIAKLYRDLLDNLREYREVSRRAVTLQALLSATVVKHGSANVLRIDDADLGKCSGTMRLERGKDCTNVRFEPIPEELKERAMQEAEEQDIKALVDGVSVTKKPVIS